MNRAAMKHYGIDPDDHRYLHEGARNDFCPACRCHYITSPIPKCDLEIARAADMEAEGFPARFCFHCHKAYPEAIDQGAICPACYRKSQAKQRRPGRYPRTSGYVSDGVGCVEKLPRWSVDWDGESGAAA